MRVWTREFSLFLLGTSAALALGLVLGQANAVTVGHTDAQATFDISGLDVEGNPVTILDVELVLALAGVTNPDAAGGTVRSTTVLVNSGSNTVSIAPLLVGTPDGDYRLWARARIDGAVSAWCQGDTIELDIPPEAPSGLTITAITQEN